MAVPVAVAYGHRRRSCVFRPPAIGLNRHMLNLGRGPVKYILNVPNRRKLGLANKFKWTTSLLVNYKSLEGNGLGAYGTCPGFALLLEL